MKSIPKFYNLLSDADKLAYFAMQTQFTIALSRNQRNKRISMFNQILSIIQRFCIKKDKNDWIRCFVCGVMWLPEGIAINNQQLRILISKCKSSINGSLVRIGYTNNLGRAETSAALVKAVPLLKDNTSELRQWTLRTKDIHSTPPFPRNTMLKVILCSDSTTNQTPPQPPSPPISVSNSALNSVSYIIPDIKNNQNHDIENFDDNCCKEENLDQDDTNIEIPKYENIIDPTIDSLCGMSAGFDFDLGFNY
ncbi:hypothetical protein M9Y10_006531 [Tritrichomonas musculus]|uniref:Initiator binding domain-containing protein n=1 Tax=Tritrichomonas musculus TaxID=1915356 RepID=A0ABR2JFK0_9EUKA